MPSQPQRLLQLSQTILEDQPWDFVDERSLFLVRLPGREEPYTVTIFGDSVDVMGVEVALEPQAFRLLARLHDPRTADAEIESYQPGRALSVVFLSSGQIPSDFKKVWKAAGYRARGGQPSPQFAANDGNEQIRPIRRSEGNLLGLCLHAVVEAFRSQLLCPPDIASGTEAALLLTVECDDLDGLEAPDLPPVRQSIVPWPDAMGQLPPSHAPSAETRAAGEAVSPGKRELALTGSMSAGSDELDVPAGAYAMHLFDPKEEMLVATSILGDGNESGETTTPPPEALELGLVELFAAMKEPPATLYVEEPALALMAFPVCHALGVTPFFVHYLDSFADLVDDTTRAHGGRPRVRLGATLDALVAIGGDSIPDEFPASLTRPEDWRDAFAYTSAMLLIQAKGSGAIESATQSYWGGHESRGRVLELMNGFGSGQAFYHYAMEDHREEPGAPTTLESLLASAERSDSAPSEELDVYRARADAHVSLFEIDGSGGSATDILDGETYSIDIDLDGVGRFTEHIVVMRRYELGGHQAFSLAGLPLADDGRVDESLQMIEEVMGAAPTHESLRTEGHRLGALWLQMVGGGPGASPQGSFDE